MNNKRNTVFFILTALLALMPLTALDGFLLFAGVGIICAALGVRLIMLERRQHDSRSRKVLFTIAGTAAAGPAFALLYNLPLAQRLWSYVGRPDEPAFFILAVLICPACYLMAAAVCIGMLVRDRFPVDSTREKST